MAILLQAMFWSTNLVIWLLVWTASFSGTDNYSIYGTKNHLQIRSLISIIKHWHKFELVGNTFTGNSGTKGIIYLDFYERKTYPVYIAGNTFTKNAGHIDSNVIFLRAKGGVSQDVYSLTPSNGNLFCMGYLFSKNAFTNNFGCSQKAGGSIYFECVNSAQDMVTNNDRYTISSITSTVGTNYLGINIASYTTSV
jgi:hypothetical protein